MRSIFHMYVRGLACVPALALLLWSGPASGALLGEADGFPGASFGDEPSVQQLLDSLTDAPGGVDAVLDQSDTELFRPASTSAEISLLFEVAGNRDLNRFGLYSADDPDQRLVIFGGEADPLAQATVSFLDGGVQVQREGSTWNLDGIGDSFGFFLENPRDGSIFFSQPALNGGAVQALVYSGHASASLQVHPLRAAEAFTATDFLLAFEDLPFGSSDRDFNDLIVRIANIRPAGSATSVPEPRAVALLGLAVTCLWGLRHRPDAGRTAQSGHSLLSSPRGE